MSVSRQVAIAGFLILSCSLGGATRLEDARRLQQQGKLAEAGKLLEDVEKEYRQAGDRPNLARSLGIHADISISARPLREDAARQAAESVQLRIAIHDTAHLADDYNTIGLADQYLGRYELALTQYRAALAADRASKDRDGESTLLDNIGNIYYFLGRYSDALHSYDDAMSAMQSAGDASWVESRKELTIANQAALYQRLGREQKALELYRGLADPAKRMSPSERARLMLNQGVLYRRLGDPVKALALYRDAQALFATDHYADGEIGAWRNIGIAEATDLGDLNAAVAAFTKANNLAQQSSNRRGAVQARLYRGQLLRRQGRQDEAENDLPQAAPAKGAQAIGLMEEQWKVLHELGRIAEERGHASDAEVAYRLAVDIIESVRSGLRLVPLRTDFLADKRDVYDSLIRLRLNDPNVAPSEIFNWMERSRARTLLDRLRGKVTLAPPDLAAVQSRIVDGTVLAEYWVAEGYHAAAVWIGSRESGIVRFPGASPAGDALLAGIPLRGRLIVVPDGAIDQQPFEQLHIPGSAQLLIEKSERCGILPSARFLNAARNRGYRAPWSLETVALADPPVTSDIAGELWEPLPGSADEARAIVQIMPGRSHLYLGADMRKQHLLEGAPVLHLATHARIDAENPDRSRIVLAHDDLLQEEVYDLDLRGTDLVTLSACETAQGKYVRGERSVQAFSQAFLAAGARSVVTSLWRVADGPTSEFMKQFYYALAQGETEGAALRSAKLQFLHSHSALADPRYWAAFVLTGDGAGQTPRVIRWSQCLMVLAVLLVFMAVRRMRGKA